MDGDGILKTAFDAFERAYTSESSIVRSTAQNASAWRDALVSSVDPLEFYGPGMRDRLQNDFSLHEASTKALMSLRSDALAYMESCVSFLKKIDAELSPSIDLPEPETFCRAAFADPSTDADGSAYNWTLLQRARAEVRRHVPVDSSSGAPIATTGTFRFGNLHLVGWEKCALFDALDRGPKTFRDAYDAEDDASIDAAWLRFLPVKSFDENAAEDEEFLEEAPREWVRLVVPPDEFRRVRLGKRSRSGAASSGPPPVITPGSDALLLGEDPAAVGALAAERPKKKSYRCRGAVHIDNLLKDVRSLAVRSKRERPYDAAYEKALLRPVFEEAVRKRARKIEKAKDAGKFSSKDLAMTPEVLDPYFVSLYKACETRDGLHDDIRRLHAYFGHPSSQMIAKHDARSKEDSWINRFRGIIVKDWTLDQLYCLEHLIVEYQSWSGALPVRKMSCEDMLHLAAYFHEGCPLKESGGRIAAECKALARRYLNLDWFDARVWEWPDMAAFKVHEFLKSTLPAYVDRFDSNTSMAQEKLAYVYVFSQSPFFDDAIQAQMLSMIPEACYDDDGSLELSKVPADVLIKVYEYVAALPKVLDPPADVDPVIADPPVVVMRFDSDDEFDSEYNE